MKNIRPVTAKDAASILEIYRPYVLDTPISFEVEPPTLKEIEQRILNITAKFPWIVMEEENSIIGYAYVSEFKNRKAYDWSVESTVYIKQGYHRKGIGKKLYQELLIKLYDLGVVNVIGGITLPNQSSVKLHESFGFKQVAQFKDAGFKSGHWWDVGYWQLQLQRPDVPKPLK